MSPDDAEVQFWHHAMSVTALDNNDANVPDLEPELFSLLQFIKHQPQHTNLFKRLFIEAGTDIKPQSQWVILYCMRDLKYPEVQTAVNEWFTAQGGKHLAPRLMGYISSLNWVYEESPWEDADFFKYHWEREHPGERWPCA